MNELKLLEDMHAGTKVDAAALLRARRRLLKHALSPSARRHGFSVRRAIPFAVGAAAMVFGLLVLLPGTPGVSPAAADVLVRATGATQAQSVPLPGQYLYVRHTVVSWYDGRSDQEINERWVPGTPGNKQVFLGTMDDGGPYRRAINSPTIFTDPDASIDDVADWLSADNGDLQGSEAAVERAGETFFDATASSEFKAKVFSALALVDDIDVVGSGEDFYGRRVTILGHSGDVSGQEFIFEDATGLLIGVRSRSRDGSEGADGTHSTYFEQRVVDQLPPRARLAN